MSSLGVVGRKAIHVLKEEQRKAAVELDGLHIDIGAADRDRALELIRIGDPVVIACDPVQVDGGRLVSRSMDNRLGAYVALESLRRCHERGKLSGRMVAIASVQEEIGLNGGATSTFAVGPDLALAIDVTHATDAPGMEEKQLGSHPLGSGPSIGRGSTLSPKVFELLCETAERLGIEYTVEASGRRTGTDADAIQISQGRGSPAGIVGIPLRYMHSPVEMVDLGDLEAVGRADRRLRRVARGGAWTWRAEASYSVLGVERVLADELALVEHVALDRPADVVEA